MRNASIFSYSKDNYTKFFYTINKKNYLFRLTFVNADGVSVDFEKSAVKELYIVDRIDNPFLEGYIVIDNTQDVIERYKSSPVGAEFNATLPERGYKVRGDARDLVLLTIIPVDPSTNPYNEQSFNYNKLFGFQYIFCLGDEEDIITEAGKNKKFKIVDFDFEIFKEKKIFFTTANLDRREKTPFLSNLNRTELTGDAMKRIITTTLEDNSAIFSTLSGSTYVTPNFESGSSRIFYSSPNTNSALDDLMYIDEFHVSNEPGKDFSILQKDHFTGEYTLQSASKLFRQAFNKSSDSGGPLFIENLSIAGTQDVSNVVENDVKKPLRALEFGETGDVLSVKFYNTPGTVYQEKIRSVLVHSYNFTDKEFSINCTDGNIENVKKQFSKLYVEPMKGKDNNPSPNFIVNNTQKTNKNFHNEFLVYGYDGDFIKYSVGRNKLLKDALLLNLGVEIMVQGGLQRQAGKFISVDRKGNYIDNDFDNKFLGIYFIISVEHVFVNDDQYYNKIMAVKTYHFNDPKINENIS